MFLRDTRGRWALGILVPISVALLLIDSLTPLLHPVRALMGYLVLPVHVLAGAPAHLVQAVGEGMTSRESVLKERNALRARVEGMHLELQRLAALQSENARLRRLLDSKQRLALSVRAAEIIGTVPDPDKRQVILDKGSRDGAYVGQPVVDADGLVGQVIEVTAVTSRVMEITDVNHAVPAEVVRSGFRVVVAGTGSADQLEVRHVTSSADVRRGDLLVSSGLDQRFPAGYPVARVVQLSRANAGPFVTVIAAPIARLDVVTHLLLVFAAGQR